MPQDITEFIVIPWGIFAFPERRRTTINQTTANRFTDTEMSIARETDLPDLLSHLGYSVRRIGSYYTTKEMDSIRIKDRRTWRRYSEQTGGDAITFVQHFCGKSFPEAVSYLLAFNGRARDSPSVPPERLFKKKGRPSSCQHLTEITGESTLISANGA